MDQLVHHLRSNLFLDFEGSFDFEKVRHLLRNDPSKEAKRLLAKLIEDGGADEMLVVLADCLAEHVRQYLADVTIRAQLVVYSDG